MIFIMKTIRRASFLICVFADQVALGLAAEPAKSGAADQSAVEVTVYNSDLGLVKDMRKI